jgi:hypothetical protein
MFSYFDVFVLSFALPQSTIIERLTVFVFRWLQLPVGVAILALPLELVRPPFILRAIFFFRWLVGDNLDHRAPCPSGVVSVALQRSRRCCHRRPGV